MGEVGWSSRSQLVRAHELTRTRGAPAKAGAPLVITPNPPSPLVSSCIGPCHERYVASLFSKMAETLSRSSVYLSPAAAVERW